MAAPQPPSAENLFGTTEGQFDIFYGLVWGTRTAFKIGLGVVLISALIGLAIGTISAFYGGVVDEIREHGLGWADEKRIAELNNLVAQYLSAKDAPKPRVDQVFTNRFAGRIKLTPQQWSEAAKQRDKFAKYFE